jgi:hypothetical protein
MFDPEKVDHPPKHSVILSEADTPLRDNVDGISEPADALNSNPSQARA